MGDIGSPWRPRRSPADSRPLDVAAEEGRTVRYDFATQEPPRLRFGIGAGRIEVETAEVAETTVDVEAIRGDLENLKVEQHGRDIVVESRKRFGFKNEEYDIRVRAPYGSEIDANIASAPIAQRFIARMGTASFRCSQMTVLPAVTLTCCRHFHHPCHDALSRTRRTAAACRAPPRSSRRLLSVTWNHSRLLRSRRRPGCGADIDRS